MYNSPMAKIVNDIKQYEENKPAPEIVATGAEIFLNNNNLNLSVLKRNINNIDEMTDMELDIFISNSYKSILRNVFGGPESDRYIKVFQNPRFLDAFINVTSKMNLEQDDIVLCNTLCYHYIVIPKHMRDNNIMNRMMNLSKIVNRVYLPSLLGLGLSNHLASTLLIARWSDIDLNICVKRVNFMIITQPKELMSVEMIEGLLRRLYNIEATYHHIFPHIMRDVLPEYEDDNINTHWITNEVEEVNSTLNLAVLNILDNLPTNQIRDIIRMFAQDQSIKNSPVRFSLRTLSEDYYRINDVVNSLMYGEGLYIY